MALQRRARDSGDQRSTTSVEHGVPGKETQVQRIAAEGVGGSGAALPFADQIAASFGPTHASTVHGIRAHTGSAATAASEDIGAKAYATGNDVAFGGAPDLHTAAHEAAHVVQQRQGVHLKGGVGAAGDPYERHADAVADRVVSGLSAASLLGDAGSASVAPAVQRKANGTEAAMTSLIAAQRQFEVGTTEANRALKEVEPGQTPSADFLSHYIGRGQVHLRYAVAVIGPGTHDDALAQQVEATSFALDAFAAAAATFRDETVNALLEGAMLTDAQLRRDVGSSGAISKPKGYQAAGKSDGAYDTAALGPTLELVSGAATHLRQRLDSGLSANEAIGAVESIDVHLRYAATLLDWIRPTKAREPFAAAVKAATDAVATLQRVIRGMPGSAKLEIRFRTTTLLADRVRDFVALPALDQDEDPRLTAGEGEHERQASKDTTAQQSELKSAIERMQQGAILGLSEFRTMALQQDPPEPPSFAVTLAKTVLEKALEFVGGKVAGVLVEGATSFLKKRSEKVGEFVEEHLSDDLKSSFTKVAIGPIKSGAEKALEGGIAEGTTAIGKARTMSFIARTLELKTDDVAQQQKDAVDELVKANWVTADDLAAMRQVFDGAKARIHAITYQEAASAWARYLSQNKLGVQSDGKGGAVTDMHQYFGKPPEPGLLTDTSSVERPDSKWGKAGMLRATVTFSDNGFGQTPPEFAHVAMDGMNNDLIQAMLDQAGWKLAGLQVPKEIHVWLKREGGTHEGRLAVDENGTLRDAFRWDAIRRWDHVGSKDVPHKEEPRLDHYASDDPQEFLTYISGITIPKSVGPLK